jgi:hypothetical protein
MAAGGWNDPRPFAVAAFRARHLNRRELTPTAVAWARVLDEILRTYPGYTLASVLDEDAHALFALRGLVNPNLGEADPDG